MSWQPRHSLTCPPAASHTTTQNANVYSRAGRAIFSYSRSHNWNGASAHRQVRWCRCVVSLRLVGLRSIVSLPGPASLPGQVLLRWSNLGAITRGVVRENRSSRSPKNAQRKSFNVCGVVVTRQQGPRCQGGALPPLQWRTSHPGGPLQASAAAQPPPTQPAGMAPLRPGGQGEGGHGGA